MSGRAVRRFWKEAVAVAEDGAYAVHLDGRPLRSPGKAPLRVPSRALAARIAAEWDAQPEQVNPAAMPMTRLANTAIDKVAARHAEVADHLAGYADTDLLCYRAPSPEALAARQRAAWDPYLDWAARALGARLQPREGIRHVPQDPAALAALRRHVHGFGPFALAALSELVTLSGSLVLGLAALHRYRPLERIWEAARIDENWQIEQWGEDAEAAAAATEKFRSMSNALRFHSLLEEETSLRPNG